MRLVLHGQPASRGLALGRAHVREPQMHEVREERIPEGAVEGEIERLHMALDTARAELQQIPVDNRLERLDGRLVIDPDRHVITVDGEAADLTVTEFGILNHLAQRPGFVRTRDQIIAAVHGRNVVLSSRTIDVHVTALRKKLGPLAGCVETVRGIGYRFGESLVAVE